MSQWWKPKIERNLYPVAIGELTPLSTWSVHSARNESLWDGEPAVEACVDERFYVKLEVRVL